MDMTILTDVGQRRTNNQDYANQYTNKAGKPMVFLADGMGGLDFPEQASKIVCEAILDYFESYKASAPSKIIQESLEYADKTLRKACYQRKCKMGTALTLVYLTDSFLYYTSLGDVRLYHEHINGTITLLTSDDVINIGGKSYLTVCINGRGYRTPIEVYQMSVQTGDRSYFVAMASTKNMM